MSDEELVQSYVEGKVGRRAFVRRLVAGGITLGAALAYADALTGTAYADGGKRGGDDRKGHDDDRPPRHGRRGDDDRPPRHGRR